MNEFEKYLFDLRDFIVARNAITTAQIDDLSTRLELHRTEKSYIPGSDLPRFNTNEDHAWTASSLLECDGCDIDLIDLPTIRPSRISAMEYRPFLKACDVVKAGIDSPSPAGLCGVIVV